MSWRARGPYRIRAIIGVIALYGLLLQGFLAAATPPQPADLRGALCLQEGSGTNDPDTPVRHDHPCCLAAHVADIVPPPGPVSPILWTSPGSAPIVRRPEAELPRTGPPGHAHKARAPPIA